MARVSVDLDAMRDLVRSLEDVEQDLDQAEQRIRDGLRSVALPATGLSGIGEIGEWATRRQRELRNQLSYAEWLAASTPGIEETVSYDHRSVPELSYEEAKQFADRAIDLMSEGRMPPPRELIHLLERYGGDSTFALLLMDGFREGDGYADHDDGPTIDVDYLASLDGSPSSERFLQLYSRALGGLTHEFDFPGAADATEARAYALLASRGEWSADWLQDLGGDIITIEREDPEVWTRDLVETRQFHYERLPTFLDPNGVEVTDPMPWVLEAMTRNPEALKAFLLSGEDVPLRITDGDDERDVDIPATLRHLALGRPWPQDHGGSLGQALATLTAFDPESIEGHVENLGNLAPVDKVNPLSFVTHLGLDVLGLAPFVGEWADGMNVSLYLTEGKYKEAGFSTAAAIPGAGAGSTVGKWIRALNSAGHAGGAVLTAQDIRDLIQLHDHVDQGAGDGPRIGGASGLEPGEVGGWERRGRR